MADDQPSSQGKEPRSDLSRLRIAKKAYVFDVRRKFALSRNFLVKREAQTPGEELKKKLQEFLWKWKAGADEDKKKDSGQKKEAAQNPPKPSGSAIKTALFVTIAFVLLGTAFVLLRLGQAQAVAAETGVANDFSGSFSFSIGESAVLSVAGEDGAVSRVAYIPVSYSSENISSLNFSARLFAERPSSQIFLLNYEREGADNYPVFRKRLLEGATRQGMTLHEIGIEKLVTLPAGATLIVPTGYLPKELLGIDSPFDYRELLSRGTTIVYIGFPFDKTALDRDGLTISVNQNALAFSKGGPESTDGFQLYDPQYVVSASKGNFASIGSIYGSVTALGYGKGYLILLPQSLDGGWRGDGEAAANDVLRLLSEERWLMPIASVLSSGMPGVKNATAYSIFTPSFSQDFAYVEFAVEAADSKGVRSRTVNVFKVEKEQKGEMYPRESRTVPYYLSGQRTRMTIELKEDSPKPVKLFIRLYKNEKMLQEEELELGLTNPTTEKPKDMQVNAEPGWFVVRVEDVDGKVYAATKLEVIGLDVSVNSTNWQTGRFSFLLSAAGQPVLPRSLSVAFDGKNERRYASSSLTQLEKKTALTYDYPGQIGAGEHSFTFTAGNFSKVFKHTYHPQKNLWDNPAVVVLTIMSLGVFAIGVVLRRPEKTRYGLDIPDFPPLSTIKIPVKRETVLKIFDDVNTGYAWQRMPLRLDEIKSGFRRLTFNGKPILVGDFNLERILAKLSEENLVKENLGYFGLVRWESESRHTVRYLTIYRILRNVFVNNAVKFSKLDAMADCDVKAIAGKEELFIHIMDGQYEPLVHRALATAKMGITIMVFATEEERDAFRSGLTSTSRLAVALKMEVNTGSILMLPVKNAVSAFLRGIVR